MHDYLRYSMWWMSSSGFDGPWFVRAAMVGSPGAVAGMVGAAGLKPDSNGVYPGQVGHAGATTGQVAGGTRWLSE